MRIVRSHLKNRIMTQSQGGVKFQSAGILKYFEALKREHNTGFGPKDIFEIASKYFPPISPVLQYTKNTWSLSLLI